MSTNTRLPNKDDAILEECLIVSRSIDNTLIYKCNLTRNEFNLMKEECKDYMNWRDNILLTGLAPLSSYDHVSDRDDLINYYGEYDSILSKVSKRGERMEKLMYDISIYSPVFEDWKYEAIKYDNSGNIIEALVSFVDDDGFQISDEYPEFLGPNIEYVDDFRYFVEIITDKFTFWGSEGYGYSLLPMTRHLIETDAIKVSKGYYDYLFNDKD